MNQNDIETYFEFLSHDYYDLRAFTPRDTELDTDISELRRVETRDEFIAFCEEFDKKANIYAGVLPKTSDGRKKPHVKQVDKVWIELDAEREEDGAATEEAVKKSREVMENIVDDYEDRFGTPLVVMSGNGYHLIWEIEPVYVTDDNRGKLDDRLNLFVNEFKEEYETDAVEVDTAVGELARILKIPGTTSVKGEEDKWRQSEIVKKPDQSEKQRRCLKDFYLMLEPDNTSSTEPQPETGQGAADVENREFDDDRLNKVMKRDEKFRELFAGRRTSDYPSRSEAELALANLCVYYGLDIDEVLSQAHISKWDEANQSYRDATRQKAESSVDETYDWDEDPKNPDKDVESGDVTSWEDVIRLFEDSNTEKTEARNKIGDFLLEKHNFKTPEDTEQLWVFQNPVYEPKGEQKIKEWINTEIGEYTTTHDVNEVVEKVKSRSFCNRNQEKPPLKYIPLENGWYNLETEQLEEPRPEYFAVNHVPVEYDPEQDCPRFKKFLHEIVHDSDVPLIQEMIGYCLYRGYPLARAFMLLGSGSNGKSTLLNILKEFLGQENIANPSLQKLGEDRFASAQLYGKLANIHADLSSKTLESTGTFKMLTGGDLIHAERKFQDPFQFENYAKLIYSANELPGTKDTSDAFFRRWIVIRFPYKFTSTEGDGNKDKNPDIVDEIICPEEMSGLFNWAVEGLKRVLEKDSFSQTRGREAVKDEWLLTTQPMQVFFEKAVEEDAGVSVGKDELYSDYCEFCEEVGVVSKDRSVFFKQLYSAFPQVSEERVRGDVGRKQRLLGITTKEIEQVVKVVKANTSLSRTGTGTHARVRDKGESPPDHLDQEEGVYKEDADSWSFGELTDSEQEVVKFIEDMGDAKPSEFDHVTEPDDPWSVAEKLAEEGVLEQVSEDGRYEVADNQREK